MLYLIRLQMPLLIISFAGKRIKQCMSDKVCGNLIILILLS